MCPAIFKRLIREVSLSDPGGLGRGPRIPLVFAVLAAAAWLVPRTAQAERTEEPDVSLSYYGEVPEDPYYAYGMTEEAIDIPSNGALLVDVDCDGDCDGELDDIEMHVVDAQDQEVAGQIVDGRLSDGSGWVGWKPRQEFERGGIFRVSGGDGMSIGPQLLQAQFKATESTESTTPTRQVRVRAKVVQLDYQGEYHCCEETDPEAEESERCSFIATDAEESVNVYLALGATPSQYRELGLTEPLVAPQYVYLARRTFDKSSTADAEWTTGSEWVLNFPVQYEYCFEVVARHVATGIETIVESRCDGNERIEFPYIPSSVEMQNAGAFAACTVPPEGEKHRWCDTYREAMRDHLCEEHNEAACQAALATCPPWGSEVGAGGAGGAGGPTSDVDGGFDNDGFDNDGFDDDTIMGANTGCSVAARSMPGSASSWQMLCWMLSAVSLFGLIWLRRTGSVELQRVRARSSRARRESLKAKLDNFMRLTWVSSSSKT